MAGSERRALSSQLERLLLHLLKAEYQPGKRIDSWDESIRDARAQIADELEESPSLRRFPPEILVRALCARRAAAKETGSKAELFPVECPCALDAILDAAATS